MPKTDQPFFDTMERIAEKKTVFQTQVKLSTIIQFIQKKLNPNLQVISTDQKDRNNYILMLPKIKYTRNQSLVIFLNIY